MSEQKNGVAVTPVADKVVEYVPFGGTESIRLTINMVRDQIAVPTREGNRPSDKECIHFLMLCKARQLNPWEGDAYLIGYETKHGPQFNLITSHQAFLKRAEMNATYDGMQAGVIVYPPVTCTVNTDDGPKEIITDEIEGDLLPPDCKLIGDWARVYDKRRSHPTYKRINVTKFQKSYGVWLENPEGMIVKCAEADALRSTYPTLLGGLYLREELERIEAPKEAAPPPKPLFGAPQMVAAPPVEPVAARPEAPEGQDSPPPPKKARKGHGKKAEPEAPAEPPTPAAPNEDARRLELVRDISDLGKYKPRTFAEIIEGCGLKTGTWEQASIADLEVLYERIRGAMSPTK